MMRWCAAAACAVAAAGCYDPSSTITEEDVVRAVTPASATLPANGAATTTITVETVTDHVKDGLKAHLTLTGAAWVGVTGGSIDLDLGPDGTATATLTAPRTPGHADVIAEISGYQRAFPSLVTFEPVAVTDFTSVTAGHLTAGMSSSVMITVQPLVDAGLPSAGTRIAFTATSTPDDSAYLTTSQVVLDATATTASTTVIAGTTTTRVDVAVAITPPGASAPSKTGTIPLMTLP